MFSESNFHSFNAQKEFAAQIKELIGSDITSMELAEIRAEQSVYDALKIKTESWQKSAYGLLIFTESLPYFYTTTQQNYLSKLGIKAAQEKQASSLINFSEIKELKFFLPGKTFFSFLKPEHKRTIEASFTEEAGRKLYFTIVTHSDAFLIYKKLTQIQA